MKIIITFLFLLLFLTIHSQTLPLNFEALETSDFVDFNGGIGSVIDNPQSSGINTSAKVAQIIRDGGDIWAGSKISLDSNINFDDLNAISMKVFTTAPVGTQVKFKLEGNGDTERDAFTTVSNQWETLTWDFSGTPTNFNDVVFMFDFGNIGDGGQNSTFLFDDVEQFDAGDQIDLPVDFENDEVNYTTTDFGGNISSLVEDPEDANNTVIQAIKTNQAATWAGTTIGTPAGFATYIPLTLTDSKMTVRVWSPAAGTPIRLKVEDANDPTHTCETEINTTVSGGWESMEFDFTNQAPGTELLSIGLSMGWQFNMASIFFNFGTEGSVAGEQTYYFDDVQFGELVLSNSEISVLNDMDVFPNPSKGQWIISSKEMTIEKLELFNQRGELILKKSGNSKKIIIDGSLLANGIYVARIYSSGSQRSLKISKI